MILLIIEATVEFSAYEGNPEMLAILDSMPPALLEAFQMNAFTLSTVTGFFGLMFTFFALLSSVFAVMLGVILSPRKSAIRPSNLPLRCPYPGES